MQNAANTYFKTQFSTMGQGEVLLLLYDGALKFLAQAKEKIQNKDIAGKGISISKALDIIAELDATLNLELGGSLAQNLHQLYIICSTRLLRANLKQDVELIQGVIDVLEGLRSAYAEIMNRPDAQQASEQIAAQRKSFSIKGSANATMQPVMPPGFGGGGRAQSAYATAARQTETAQTQSPAQVLPPPVFVQPSIQAPYAATAQTAQPAQAAQATVPTAQATAQPAQAAQATVPTAQATAQPVQNALLTPLLPTGIRRTASMAAYGRAAQLPPS